jgi:pantothenate kinase type III
VPSSACSAWWRPRRALCLLNGGAAGSLAPHLECPLRLVDNLVLEGLAHMRQEL